MADETPPPVPPPPPAPQLPQKPRRAWDGRWQRWVAAIVAVLLVIVVGALVWLDTSAGHRFLASRVATIKSASGLRITVGRIDGSIYRRAVLSDLTLSDPRGLFFDAPRVELDWFPFAWASNRLDIDRLTIPRATLHKLPKPNPTQRRGPILPGFDIRLMQFSVGRLAIAPAITGKAQTITIAGDADIRGGRAVIDLSARTVGGGDLLAIALDSRPDNDRFSLDVTVNAPKGGVLATMAGLKQAANLRIGGKGSWTRWDGRLAATLDAAPAADFVLAARSGAYSARGTVEGEAIVGNGLIARMANPRLAVRASGTLVDRVIDGRASLRSAAFDLDADGAVDLRNNALDNMLLTLRLARPQALVRNMRGRDVAAKVRLDGAFAALGYEYLLTAKELAFDRTVIHDVRAQGRGRKGNGPALVPLSLRAARLDGQGDLVAGIVRNFQIDGVLQMKGQQIVSNPMPFRSDKLRGRLVMLVDLASGRYDFGLDGQINGLFIRNFGIVDLTSKLKAMPRRDGGFGLSGAVAARVRRLDNEFLRTLGGGLPSARSNIELLPDGRIALASLTLDSPLLRLSGAGIRNPDQTLHIEAQGRHVRYGPLDLTLDGMIERPEVRLLLHRPMDALGLREVKAHLVPDAGGYSYTADGDSALGPFTGRGVILLPPGGQAVVRVANLAVSGVTASGDIRPVAGGLDGQLGVTGPVTGTVGFQLVTGVQQVQVKLTANDASFDGPTIIAVRRGSLDGTIRLAPSRTTLNATAQARGLRVGGVLVGRFAANAQLTDGSGTIRASLSGQRGRIFDIQGEAQVAPDRTRLSAQGTIDRRSIRLERPALLNRTSDGWRLSPVTVSYAGGSLQLGGELGQDSVRIEARMQRLPLSLLDIAYDNLGLGGLATGSLTYVKPRDGTMPTGKAELRIRGLSRSGLSLTSRPVDAGVNAVLTQDRLATRMVFVADGATIGRAQALLHPLPGGSSLVDRLNRAPFFGQLRYNGTADTLWRLTGVEIVDIGGPVAVSANMRGTLGQPVITGTLATDSATIASPITGMRLRDVQARGRFSGAQLVISSFAATARNGGAISGAGSFTFNGIAGVGMDLSLQAENAALLERDDIAATVTGPISLRSNGTGGTIGGDLLLNRSRFTMGRAAAVAQIPELKVVEINRRGEEVEVPRATVPWALAIKARARNRLMVTGLGLDSEWRADLDIGGTVTNPAIAGRAQLVRGGYEFAGRRFDLREGNILFDGKVPTNPTLDINAEANVSDLNATIHVGGTGLKPDISFTSTPALPQDELLSRILFGTSITNLSAPEALQLASAVGSLQGQGGLDPINAVRKAAGLDRLRIIAADPTQGQGTSLAAGKYLTRKTYVELITDGQGYSATRIEYQVTRWLSLLAAISTLGRESANVRVSKDY